ncbi:MAG: [protein-PII] uridylyltransferase [Candidatus Abyssobacteria bacterium SURF_17]|uniref:Bifunctional uridylyltransferase/uridylyl-removing enzyme n=1 Tax=Candidatus Abyssobacteria bacterium SURF_17 TaxID=2093361 RepID=A0A419EU21_9BACT|nr:MAG: [protein-PII] uridylyltransferase [Candidatus Abyssubacteria bacterium SURF_17]
MNYSDELKQAFAEALASTHPDAGRNSFLAAAKHFVARKKDELHQMHFAGAGGATVVGRYTALVDALVKALHAIALGNNAVRVPHALIALGGYGRGEMNFSSDVDIMFLHEGRLEQGLEAVNDYLLCFLWDIGFKVGHSIRCIRESLKLAAVDDTVLTSMLESRFLAGDMETYETFFGKLMIQTNSLGVKHFVRRKEQERNRTYHKAGRDVFQSEPDIKHSAGGLRDYHTGVWVALAVFGLKSPRDVFTAGLITEEQFLRLERALDFMWRVRNQLYFEEGLPQDALTLRRQERVAHAFGYRSSRGALAVERFMRDYYIYASELHRFCKDMLRLGGLSERGGRQASARMESADRGLKIADRQLYVPADDSQWFRENPARLLEVVWYAQKQGLMLSDKTRTAIRASLDLIDERFCMSPVAKDYFLAILSDPARVGTTIRQMSEVGILDRYLPEFSTVRHVIRYDPFHQYPVDEHTIRALENLAAIPHLSELGTAALKKVLSEIRSPEILSLAILLHDVGKTDEGSHVKQGVRIAEAVGMRLALNDAQMDTLKFLIHNHLKMTHLSQYRDLDDMEIIRSFASEVGSEENLDMLYLLTFADLYAVRQGAWNDWKSALLFQLYSRTKQMLSQPPTAEPEQPEYWNTPKARAVCMYLQNGELPAVNEHLRRMSPRYLSSFSPKEIADHMRMAASLRRVKAVFKCVSLPAYSLSHVTICAKDRLGLFADIAGTFASQQVSILSAGVFTRSDGIAIDSFHVVDGETDGPLASTKWMVVRENLRKVLKGERDVKELIRSAERRPRIAQRKMSSLRRGVYFDNRVSATHTVIDIEAPDRIGLLYDIASTLTSLGLDLSLAKVATDVRQARDAFYVTDGEGKKITGPLRIRKIRERIEEVLESDHGSAWMVSGESKRTKRSVKTK